MINKQTLVIAKAEDKEIIAINESTSSYVDEDYFENAFGENSSRSNTFAVKMQAIRADWIINDPEGIIFLKQCLRSKRKEIFMTPYIKMLT